MDAARRHRSELTLALIVVIVFTSAAPVAVAASGGARGAPARTRPAPVRTLAAPAPEERRLESRALASPRPRGAEGRVALAPSGPLPPSIDLLLASRCTTLRGPRPPSPAPTLALETGRSSARG